MHAYVATYSCIISHMIINLCFRTDCKTVTTDEDIDELLSHSIYRYRYTHAYFTGWPMDTIYAVLKYAVCNLL